MTYIYGMRLRGFSPGTFPKEGFKEILDEKECKNYIKDRKYWDYLEYDRKLTENELEDYELDYLGEKLK